MPSLQIAVQNEFHQKLREEAIDHLAYSNQIVARSFRHEYSAAGLGAHKQFLRDQEKNGAWGTYIEAVALSEKYNVNLIVTPVTGGVKQDPICLYRSANPDAKTMYLYNSNNTHWYVDSQTKGYGNCLYNAYAQALFNLGMIKPEQINEKTSPVKATDVSISFHSIFSNKHQDDVRTRQEAIQAAISKAPTPAEREEDFERERERISRLSPEEQKQISDDHAYALRLAREEGSQISAPHTESNFTMA